MTEYRAGVSSDTECDRVIGEIWAHLREAGLEVGEIEGPSETWRSARFWIRGRHRRSWIWQDQMELVLVVSSWTSIPLPSGSSGELADFVARRVRRTD